VVRRRTAAETSAPEAVVVRWGRRVVRDAAAMAYIQMMSKGVRAWVRR
jgi:hypothetical protein